VHVVFRLRNIAMDEDDASATALEIGREKFSELILNISKDNARAL